VVAFIEAYRDQFGAGPVCRILRQAGVRIAPSAYYAARARPPPARAVRDAALEKQVQRVYKDSGERYGAWKVWDQLSREGIPAARCTVERLMRKLGLRGVRRGGYKNKPRTTVPDPSRQRPADLVNRDFAPGAPDRLWVVDFTFVPTWAGTAYTALVIDAFSRLIAGWRTAAHHRTDLVLDALAMAVTHRARQGVKVAGLIHHSDAGSEPSTCRSGTAPSWRPRGSRRRSGRPGTPTTTRWPSRSSACTRPRSSTTWGRGKPPPRSRRLPPNGPAGATPGGSCGAPQAARRPNTSRPGAMGPSARSPARGPGSRPRRPAEGGGHGRR